MSKRRYDIKSLIETFGEHAEIYEKSRREDIRKFHLSRDAAENLPEYLEDDFNVSLAVLAMLVQIEYLIEEVAYLRGKIQKM